MTPCRSYFPRRVPRPGFTLIEMLVVIAVICTLMAILLPAVQRVRLAAARTGSNNNLKEIAKAIQSFNNTYLELPYNGVNTGGYPAGAYYWADKNNPLLTGSWAFRILPFIGEDAAFKQCDGTQATDSAINASIKTYLCPGRGPRPGRKTTACSGAPSFPAGSPSPTGTMIDYALNGYLNGYDNWPFDEVDLISGYDLHRSFGDLTRGASNTILLGEKAMATNDYSTSTTSSEDNPIWVGGWKTAKNFSDIVQDKYNGTPWIHEMNNFGSPFPGSCPFALADGSVRGLPYDFDPRPAMLPTGTTLSPLPP